MPRCIKGAAVARVSLSRIAIRKHVGTLVNRKRSVSSTTIQLRGSNPTSIVRNKKIVELGRNKMWKEILLIHQKEKKDFSNVNYATIMSQLGCIQSVDCTNPSYRAFVADLANQIEVRGMKWVGAQGAGNIMHTIGKMNLKSESAQKIVQFVIKEENAKWLVKEGKPQNIANTVWACAKLGVEAPNLFSQVDKHAKWLVEEGTPQAIANTVWACATLGVELPNLFSQVDKHAKWLVEEGNPQNIANTVWACATFGVVSPNLFSLVDKHAKWLVEEGKHQGIANTIWACATLGVEAPNLFSQVDKHAKWLVEEGNPQDIANTVWAFASLGVELPNLFLQVDKHAKWLVEEGNPQDVANTVWACAKLGVESPNLFSLVDKHAKWLVEEGNPQDIANTVWACATLGEESPNLLLQVERNINKLLLKGSSEETEEIDDGDELVLFVPTINKYDIDDDSSIEDITEEILVQRRRRQEEEMVIVDDEAESEDSHQFNDDSSIEDVTDQVLAERIGPETTIIDEKEATEDSFSGKESLDKPQMSRCLKGAAVARLSLSRIAIRKHAGTLVNRKRSVSSTTIQLRGSNPTSIARNKKIMELGRNKAWKEILLIHQKEKKDFSNVNYATIMSQLGRIQSVDCTNPSYRAFVADLANQIEVRGMKWVGTQGAGNIMHTIGKMNLKSESARKIVQFVIKEENAKWLVEEGTPQAIANTVWACAKLGVEAPNLFSQVDKHAKWLVEHSNPQNLANTVWACATLGVELPNLFSQVDKHAKWLVEEGNPQNIANTVWACATLGVVSPNLFSLVDKHAKWLVKESKHQGIVNTVWACATLGVELPNLFSQVDKHVKWLVEEGNPQDIANTVWAFASLGVELPNLFLQVDKHAKWLVEEGNPQDVANTVWACAKLGVESPNLFSLVDKHAKWLVEEGNPQDIANTVWACATLGVEAPNLFSHVDKHAKWLVEEGNPQDIANTVWACASLGVESPNLFLQVERNINKLLLKGSMQTLCNTCYALVLLDLGTKHNTVLTNIWNQIMQNNGADLSKENLGQLAQVEAFAKAAGINLLEPSPELRARMCSIAALTNQESRYQKEVSDILTELGFMHEKEVPPMEDWVVGSMLAIDMACRERNIAIEYDGPFHYLKGFGKGEVTRVENGATKAKRSFLERVGWKVININYHDWIEAKRRKSRGKEWLKEKLLIAGISL